MFDEIAQRDLAVVVVNHIGRETELITSLFGPSSAPHVGTRADDRLLRLLDVLGQRMEQQAEICLGRLDVRCALSDVLRPGADPALPALRLLDSVFRFAQLRLCTAELRLELASVRALLGGFQGVDVGLRQRYVQVQRRLVEAAAALPASESAARP